MKALLYLLIISALAFAGCSNKSSSTEDAHEHSDGSTHIHENGEVHETHDTIQQQEFTIDQNSVTHQHHDHSDSTHSHPH
jgi:hypothetical protein